MSTQSLTITTPSDREVTISRVFNAPRRLVYDAFTKPELLMRWFSGPPGWTLVVCEIDLRVGGTYRYVWRNDGTGSDMGMGGTYLEITAPERIVATEKFDESWYPGEATDTTVFVEHDGTTTLTITVLYDSREIRDAVLKTPMLEGMGAGYDKLDEFLASEMAQEVSR